MYKIFLSPSNQTSNVGAYKTYGTNECEVCEDIAYYVKEYLSEYDCDVMIAERKDNITTRVQKAKEWGANVYIPIHTNASSNTSVWGVETFYYSSDDIGKALAIMLDEQIGNLIGKKRASKAKDTLGELKFPDFAVRAYIECDFHSNPERAKWLVENKQILGNCIANTLIEYFDIYKKVNHTVNYKVQIGIYNTAEEASNVIKDLSKWGYNGFMIEIERY